MSQQVREELLPRLRQRYLGRGPAGRSKILDEFGSFSKGSASSESDIDLLVEFQEPDKQPSKRLFGLVHGLGDSLGRPVDQITFNSIRNPYFNKRVLRGSQEG